MKVVILQAGKDDQAIKELLHTIQKVLEELQVEVKYISLQRIPYYVGAKEHIVDEILCEIEQSSGVIMASRAELLSVSGSLCAFFEHCSTYRERQVFHKPLFAIAASDWRGQREAAEYMLHAWDILGGIEFGKFGVHTPSYVQDSQSFIAYIEKMTEDFYRIMKQSRPSIKNNEANTFGMANRTVSVSTQTDKEVTPPFYEVLQKTTGDLDVDHIRSMQEKDIEDIANMFKKQLREEVPEETNVHIKDAIYSKPAPVPVPRLRGAKQMVSNLPHYFQAQYAVDFQAVVQYHLLSEEPFDGYVKIQKGDCSFHEGQYPGAEIELTASDEVFKNIFTKKITAQKAFMLGQLKVRGNFMLLPTIDQMFKKM